MRSEYMDVQDDNERVLDGVDKVYVASKIMAGRLCH